jgi:hypothetical protein
LSWDFLGLNIFREIGSAKGPLTRTIPIPLSPKGVAMAAIVSSWMGGVFPGEKGAVGDLLEIASFPFPFPQGDDDFLDSPFT